MPAIFPKEILSNVNLDLIILSSLILPILFNQRFAVAVYFNSPDIVTSLVSIYYSSEVIVSQEILNVLV